MTHAQQRLIHVTCRRMLGEKMAVRASTRLPSPPNACKVSNAIGKATPKVSLSSELAIMADD
jgi:hypothetical protein